MAYRLKLPSRTILPICGKLTAFVSTLFFYPVFFSLPLPTLSDLQSGVEVQIFGIQSASAQSLLDAVNPAAPANFWECMIKRLNGVETDTAATAVKRQCRSDFPDFYWRRALPKDQGLLGFSTKASECITKGSEKTPSRVAKALLREACIANFPR